MSTSRTTSKSATKTPTKSATKATAKAPARATKKPVKPTATRKATTTPVTKPKAATGARSATAKPSTKGVVKNTTSATRRTARAPETVRPATPERMPGTAPLAAPAPEVMASAPRAPRENSAQARVIAMISAPEGATLDAIMNATGWQAHTVRGFISGTARSKLGLKVDSTRIDGERTYRIAA